MHGVPKSIRIKVEAFRDQLIGKRDRRLLEVLPKREVAEHLEEGEMACGRAQYVNVLRPDALLARSNPVVRCLLLTEQVRLERDHPRNIE